MWAVGLPGNVFPPKKCASGLSNAEGGLPEPVDSCLRVLAGADPGRFEEYCNVNGPCLEPVSDGPLVASPGEDTVEPICTAAGLSFATPAPRLEAFARSFEHNRFYNFCDPDWPLYGLQYRITEFLHTGCLQNVPCGVCDPSEAGCIPYPRCAGATGSGATLADRLVVRVLEESGPRTLAPCADYDVAADADCAGGFRLLLEPGTVPTNGTKVEMVYAEDLGSTCSYE